MEEPILKGMIDLHFHAGPDVRERKLNYLEAAIQARDAGMKAILIKSHSTITADIASLIQPLVKDILVFGGIALNYPLGGLNLAAVETALKLGAKQIWMPTLDAANQYRYEKKRGGILIGRIKCGHPDLFCMPTLDAANQYRYEKKRGGITILSREGTLKKEVIEILEILSSHDVMLSTGHLSKDEIMVLLTEARKRKIKKILVTHPDHFFIQMPVKMQKDLAAKRVLFDRCFPTPRTSPLTMEEMAKRIREVGVSSSVLTSDFGQPENPFPVEGLKIYIQKLIQQGFSNQEIDQMARINPGRLLSLVKD